MEIKTKYSIGDKVFQLVGTNIRKDLTVAKISIKVNDSEVKVRYIFTDGTYADENTVFSSKEELFEYLNSVI